MSLHVLYDHGVLNEASMIFVALTNSVGGFETIAPDAKLMMVSLRSS